MEIILRWHHEQNDWSPVRGFMFSSHLQVLGTVLGLIMVDVFKGAPKKRGHVLAQLVDL